MPQKLIEREFALLQYYPQRSTYEFYNVGVFVKEQRGEVRKMAWRMLSPNHIITLSESGLLDGEILKKSILNFLRSIEKRQVENFLDHLYPNLLGVSSWMQIRGAEPLGEFANFLYDEYVGAKFQN